MVPERPPLETASAVNKVFMIVLHARPRRLLTALAKPPNGSTINGILESK
jgi:hypothetical protein